MNTAFNQRHHLNRWCVVLSRDSLYAVESMCYANLTKKWKTGKHPSMIQYARLRM